MHILPSVYSKVIMSKDGFSSVIASACETSTDIEVYDDRTVFKFEDKKELVVNTNTREIISF